MSNGNTNFINEPKFWLLEALEEGDGIQQLQLGHPGRLGFQTAAAAELNSSVICPVRAVGVTQGDHVGAENAPFSS